MAANGQLVFTDVDKVTFKGVGNTSNAVIDTNTGKIGVGVDSPDANLHVVGNCFVSTNFELGGTMTMGTVTVRAQHELSAITATGNVTPHTIQFSNVTTGIVTTANVEVGGTITTTDINVTGNLNVLGTKTIVDTDNLRVKDPIIELGKDNTVSPIVDLGLILTRPTGNSNVAIIFDESTDKLEIGYTQSNASDTDITMRSAATEPLDVNVNGNVFVGKELTVSGNVAVDTDTLFVDSVNDRVGIGTTSPGAPLDVFAPVASGTQRTALRLTTPESASGTGCNLDFFQDTANVGRLASVYEAAGQLGMAFSTWNGGLGERVRIDASGNVGIGTTTPGAKLDVNGSTRSGYDTDTASFFGRSAIGFVGHSDWAGFAHIDMNSGTNYSLLQNSAGRTILNCKSTEKISFSSGDTAKMTMLGTGNVGIGVTNPDNTLEVRGNIQASQSDADHGMIIDKGGTVRRDYGGNGAGLHFTGNEIRPTNYAGSYSNGGIDLGNTSYRWNNVYTEALNANGIVTATNLDLDGTVIRSAANITLTANTWNKIADFSSFTTGGYYLISIKWSNSTYVSTGGTCIWYGGATYSTYVVGGSDLYNATGQENITYNANVHYRVIDPFLFTQDSDASNGAYGKHSIYMKSPQSSVVANSVAVVAYRIS